MSPENNDSTSAEVYDLYSAYMPEKPRGLLGRVLHRWLSRIPIDETGLKQIQRQTSDATILYAVGQPGWLPFFLLTERAGELGLEPPSFAHYKSLYPFQTLKRTLKRLAGIAGALLLKRSYPNPYRDGFVERMVNRGEAQVVFLKQFEGLPRRFALSKSDPLTEIVKMVSLTERRLIIVPVILLHAKSPVQETNSLVDLIFGPPDDPGGLRTLWNLMTRPGSFICRMLPPINLRRYVAKHGSNLPPIFQKDEELAYDLRREMLDQLDKERYVIQGPMQKSREEIVDVVAHDRKLLAEVKKQAEADGKDFLKEYYQLPREYAEEMASDYTDSLVRFLERILTWFFGRTYTAIEVRTKNLRKVRQLAREMPVVYVPCHKSHLDYLLVSYVLYHQHMIPPHIIAGINLNFWPFSIIFRKSGAIFMRRSFKGQPVYAMTFAKYIETLLDLGYNIEFFLEGGRSRVGKLILPKLGFMSIVLSAVRNNRKIRDLLFVPISIDYERIFEERFYLKELSGKGNEGENLGTVFKHRRMMLTPQGSVHLTFAEPFTLSEHLKSEGLRQVPKKRADSMKLAERIAYRLSHAINRESLTTPASIVAAALIANPRRGVLRSDVVSRCGTLVRLLHRRNAKLQDTVLTDQDWVDKVLALLAGHSLVRLEEDPSDPNNSICFVEDDKRLALSLYRNTLIQHIQFLSLLAVAITGKMRKQNGIDPAEAFSDFQWLMELMRYEFIFSDQPRPDEDLQRKVFGTSLEYMLDHSMMSLGGGRICLIPETRDNVSMFAGQAAGFVDGYYTLCRTLDRYKNRSLTEKDLINYSIKKAERLIGLGEIVRHEAISKNIFDNAVRALLDAGIVQREEQQRRAKTLPTYKTADREALSELTNRLSKFIGQ